MLLFNVTLFGFRIIWFNRLFWTWGNWAERRSSIFDLIGFSWFDAWIFCCFISVLHMHTVCLIKCFRGSHFKKKLFFRFQLNAYWFVMFSDRDIFDTPHLNVVIELWSSLLLLVMILGVNSYSSINITNNLITYITNDLIQQIKNWWFCFLHWYFYHLIIQEAIFSLSLFDVLQFKIPFLPFSFLVAYMQLLLILCYGNLHHLLLKQSLKHDH